MLPVPKSTKQETILLKGQNKASTIHLDMRGDISLAEVSGRILTSSSMDARNTFDEPENVKPIPFKHYSVAEHTLEVELPAMSVTVLTIC